MVKKMKLPFLYHSKSLDPKLNSSSSPPWPFPACGNIKTLSFRDDAFTTYNSTFIDTQMTPPASFFTVSSSSGSFSTVSEEDSGDPIESVIRGLRSDRLFFEPELTSSLSLRRQVEQQKECQDQEEQQCNVIPTVEVGNNDAKDEGGNEKAVYKESQMLSMESHNPCEDFRKSMEEMVEALEVKDWKGLEELLGCYLEINGKINHGYIMGAFIDLLVSLSFTNSFTTPTTSTSTSTTSSSTNFHCSCPSSPLSFPSSSLSTTPCLSSLLDHNDKDNDNDGDADDEDEDDDGLSS